MKISDLLRYAIWAAVALTANANRRHYRMHTTWLPHLVTNSISLLFPDVARALLPRRERRDNVVEAILRDMVADNERYVVYVAPLAAGYILSHPGFNIYKGDLAELRLAGFGLDAIPHSATAFALTALVHDSLKAACMAELPDSLLTRLANRCEQNATAVSFGVLAAITAGWEYAEYSVHHHELSLRGDVSQINMQWSARDTAQDVLSNMIGWAAAVLWQRRGERRAWLRRVVRRREPVGGAGD